MKTYALSLAAVAVLASSARADISSVSMYNEGKAFHFYQTEGMVYLDSLSSGGNLSYFAPITTSFGNSGYSGAKSTGTFNVNVNANTSTVLDVTGEMDATVYAYTTVDIPAVSRFTSQISANFDVDAPTLVTLEQFFTGSSIVGHGETYSWLYLDGIYYETTPGTATHNVWVGAGSHYAYLSGMIQADGYYAGWDGTVIMQHGYHLHIGGDAVPEPASLAALGLGALAAVRRRKR